VPKWIFAIIILSSCGLFNKSKTSDIEAAEEVAEIILEEPNRKQADIGIPDAKAKMASAFAYALYQNDFASLSNYLPTVGVVRQIAEKETSGMSDKEVQEKMVKMVVDRFEANFNKLQEGIDENDIDRTKLKYKEYKVEADPNSSLAPVPMQIIFGYDGKDEGFNIPVTMVEIDNKCTLFEILMTSNIFSR
jgi:hypothetical protein